MLPSDRKLEQLLSLEDTYNQGYHRSTPKNKHAEVSLPKSRKLFNVKVLKIGEDQTKRSSHPQSPDFPLKIAEDQKKKGLHVHKQGCLGKIRNRATLQNRR